MKIVSGGQTGVDRAALDVAIALGLPHGGFCPRGRRAEDGTIPERYTLTELASEEYSERTERNVLASDATLVIVRDEIAGGTKTTIAMCEKHGKPCFVCSLADAVDAARSFVGEHDVVNVAGPRESEAPGIGEEARVWLMRVLSRGRSVTA